MNINPVPIPHLSLGTEGFFFELEKDILRKQTLIESWFRHKWQQTPPMLTCSVDLRNAGFKLSAVDANLFPAGFNNLNPTFLPLSIQAFQNVLLERYSKCKNIMIIPENHTRNPYYYQSLHTLQMIIKNAGYGVNLGSMVLTESQTISINTRQNLTIYPIIKKGNDLTVNNITPCLILLNNDLSEGIPELLKGITQTIDPPPQLGWFARSKSRHFEFYKTICNEFSKLIEIDPWKVCPLHKDCNNIDLSSRDGIDCLVDKADMLFSEIQEKYTQYNIKSDPFVILKPDAGTYGRGVMTLHYPSDIKHLNRKQRQSLLTRKGNQPVNHLLLQEGIPTIETIGENQAVAEPVVYMLGQYVIGGFYRLHPFRAEDESLNSPGMQFEPLAFATCCNQPSEHLGPHDAENRFYVYSVIARLSLLATCLEKRVQE
jgi:glutamate--cysteine ligase